MMELAITMLVAAGLTWVIYKANRITQSHTWRKCMRCGCYFNEIGETTLRPPLSVISQAEDVPWGVCEDCRKDVDFK